MNAHPLERTAREVCSAYAETQAGMSLEALGNHGGFSGSCLWRVQTFAGTYCLRAWPPAPTDPAHFQQVDDLLTRARQAGLTFVPQVLKNYTGLPWLRMDNRFWELSTWMPGVADFHEHPTLARLEAAMEALAQLHRVWKPKLGTARCPAIHRRLSRLTDWQGITPERVQHSLRAMGDTPLVHWLHRAWEQFQHWSRRAVHRLELWPKQTFPLQFCLCDIWHDHVLFEGSQVTGIVDYGSVRRDNVATDLARLLGSFVGDDQQKRLAALNAYANHRALSTDERDLVDLLDWTGVVVGAGNWLRWLCLENRRFENEEGVIKRLSELVTRMERWNDSAHRWQPVGE